MSEPMVQSVDGVPMIQPRPTDAHKGNFGRVLIVGGSAGMIGAPAMATMAALRSGAGLATMATPATIQPFAAILCECATSLPLACEADGWLKPDALEQFRQVVDSFDILAIGPGFGLGEVQQQIIEHALASDKPVVLDADGLTQLAMIDDWPAKVNGPLILTPHPGEFARLTQRDVADIQSKREMVALEAIETWTASLSDSASLMLVLKGANTVVTDGQSLYVNNTGNPGMATGGSGDVLTGMIAGRMAAGETIFDAANQAVFAHGRAGDMAAEELSQTSLIGTDLLEFVSQAYLEIGG